MLNYYFLTRLAENNIPLLHQSSYSPDLAPLDFYLIPKIKMDVKGSRFDTVEERLQHSRF